MTAEVVDITAPTLYVAEVFGPTYQGEGPSTGQRAAFVRLGGCNLHCSWCDSAFTWDATRFDLRAEITPRSLPSIVADVDAMDPDILVITGGEPLLHQDGPGFRTLVGATDAKRIEIETNGTVTPNARLVTDPKVAFNVSPKLAHAGDPEHTRIVPAAIAALRDTTRARWKFVIRAGGPDMLGDLEEVDRFAGDFGIHPRDVWVMPEGVTVKTVVDGTARLADPALAHGYNLTTRLHVIAWGNERGR